MIGLFTREEAKVRKGPSKKLSFTPERLHQLGVKAVADMNPDAKHPDMLPTGSKHPLVYILGEVPGPGEDKTGEHFVGAAGNLLRAQIPNRYRKKIRWNNVVRTRTSKDRPPVQHEIECFRPGLIKDIERAKPLAILGCGPIPLNWMLGKTKGIIVCRGRRFPVRIGTHECWYYPIMHPDEILEMIDNSGSRERRDNRKDGVPGKRWEQTWKGDVSRMFRELETLPNDPPPIVHDDELFEGLTCFREQTPQSARKIIRFLNEAATWKRSGIDLETNRRRPYEKGGKILSVAIGKWGRTIAFPLEHPRYPWPKRWLRRIIRAFIRFLKASVVKIAHNAVFELEWLAHRFGWDILRAGPWRCTMVGAYVLDERQGGLSLNFLTLLRMGLKLKEQLKVKTKTEFMGLEMDSEAEIDRSKLEVIEIDGLLRYNGLDTKFTDRLDHLQIVEIKRQKLMKVFRKQLRRLPTVVVAQLHGLPVQPKVVKRFDKKFTRMRSEALKAIEGLKCVKRYTKRFGAFNPESPDQVTIMLRDVLGRKEGVRGKKYSSDEETLSKIKLPISQLILNVRKSAKLKTTYVDALTYGHERSRVHPDGKLHPIFNTTRTTTTRLSSEDPNGQNFPKRKNIEVREMIFAGERCVLIAADHGQLEARGIAMASKDKALVKSFWDHHDFHMDWAEKIVRKWPKTIKERYGDLPKDKMWKAWRADIKNQWSFPLFYGSSLGSAARNLDAPERVIAPLYEEFWDTFNGVKQWQERSIKVYFKHGYIETLTGFRRHGPMSDNKIVNTVVQGGCSDIVIDGMDRMSELAQERDEWFLSPVLNLHDDLTLIVPEKKAEYAIETLVGVMLTPYVPFLNVPLLVEVSMGTDWAHMSDVGKFDSSEIELKQAA